MVHLFSIAELLAATGGRAQNISAGHILDISIDSRSVNAGSLFVAIKGDRFDGHEFVAASIKNGAVAGLVSASRAKELAGLPLIIVPDALDGLVDIARAARQRSGAEIVAITGSVGKTTTKEMIADILKRAGPTHASIKSYNNHWGVPLMVANLAEAAKFAVFEIGMNHKGEITPLSTLVRPDVALVTSVAPAHIGNFANIEAIAHAKAEIFAGLEADGVAILNADHDQTGILMAAAKLRGAGVITYGFSPSADVRIKNYRDDENGCKAELIFGSGGVRVEVKLPVMGTHMMVNAAGALCVAERLGIARETSIKALAAFTAPKGRGASYRLGPKDNPLLLIDESYNANPVSMRAALANFARIDPGTGRKILILGDMFELGEQSGALHEALCADLLASGAGAVFLVGPYMQGLEASLRGEITIGGSARTSEEIKGMVLESLAYGDAVMVKGANGLGLGQVVQAILDRFGGANRLNDRNN